MSLRTLACAALPVAIAVLALLGAAAPGVHAAQMVTTEGPGRVDDAHDARGEWTWHDGRIIAWHLVHEDDTTTTCAHGHAIHIDGAGGAIAGRCGGSAADPHTGETTLWFAPDDTDGDASAAFEAQMTAENPGPVEEGEAGGGSGDAAGATPIASLLGVVFTALTFVFLASTLLVGVLYLHERRFRDYLVRRLFEETKGRLPAHWPEGRSKAHIARLIARGKN